LEIRMRAISWTAATAYFPVGEDAGPLQGMGPCEEEGHKFKKIEMLESR